MAVVGSVPQFPPEPSVDSFAQVLFEGIDVPVFLHDLAGRILEVNKAGSKRLGFSRDELRQLNIKDSIAVEITTTPVTYEGQAVFLAIVRDINQDAEHER